MMIYRYCDNAIGPIGGADFNLLTTIGRYLHAPRVLEFGSLVGHSARCWLLRSAEASHLTCVDACLTQELRDLVSDYPGKATLVECRQEEFRPPPEASYDLVFFDASHDCELNLATLGNIEPSLAQGALLLVHDTGLWAPEAMTPAHHAFPGACLPDGRKEHQPGEREFVRRLQANGWNCVTLQSKTALRHGLTLCQKTID
jgi:predicted O-methyltransferase YrrM